MKKLIGFVIKQPFSEIDGFKEAWTSYYLEMENLARRLWGFLQALDLNADYFKKFIQHPISALRR